MKQETYDRLMKFRDDRDWSQFHTGENLAKSLVIEAGELLEVFHRRGRAELLPRAAARP